MSGATSSSLGSARTAPRPPAGGPQAGAPRAFSGQPGYSAARQGTTHALEVTSATRRQLEYWTNIRGLLTEHQDIGTGRRREFTDADLETIEALARLASVGCRDHWLELAVDAIRGQRVTAGEWLVVTTAGHTLRCTARDLPKIVHHDGAAHAAWLVPLQAFDKGQPR